MKKEKISRDREEYTIDLEEPVVVKDNKGKEVKATEEFLQKFEENRNEIIAKNGEYYERGRIDGLVALRKVSAF